LKWRKVSLAAWINKVANGEVAGCIIPQGSVYLRSCRSS
jgi:hypothetical protein